MQDTFIFISLVITLLDNAKYGVYCQLGILLYEFIYIQVLTEFQNDEMAESGREFALNFVLEWCTRRAGESTQYPKRVTSYFTITLTAEHRGLAG